jgi:hypothetical protein
MKLVHQIYSGECGLACAATVLGLTLDQVIVEYRQLYPQLDQYKNGVLDDELVVLLTNHGLSNVRCSLTWNLEPAIVTVPSLNYRGLLHYIVWDGTDWLDPAPAELVRYPDDAPEIGGKPTVCWASVITWDSK